MATPQATKIRARQIRDEIKKLAEELRALPFDEKGHLSWNMISISKQIKTLTSKITREVK